MRKLVVTYTQGDARIFDNYDEFTHFNDDNRTAVQVMWADVFDPQEKFTRYWVSIKQGEDGKIRITSQETSEHSYIHYKRMVEEGTMNGSWGYEEGKTAHGSGRNYIEAMKNAVGSIQ